MRLRLPWRLTHLGGLYNTVVGVRLRRPWLLRWLAPRIADLPDDITVLIGHRNRADYRLRNALRSIQDQRYLFGRVRCLVLDYGSEPEQLERVREIAATFDAECLAFDATEWNRSHCLNLGLKRITTKFVMLSDIDVLLATNYLAEAVRELRQAPLSFVVAKCTRLPEALNPMLVETEGRPCELEPLRAQGRQLPIEYDCGMVVGYTALFHLIRGYDEFFRLYGSEDTDIVSRFENLGLRLINIDASSFYLHQWHPRREGVKTDALEATITRNLAYLSKARSLKRNPNGWGEGVVRST